MPFCSLAGEAAIFASTPLDNLFIQEYMLRAPGSYVKVYIYGLMQSIYPSTAESDITKFASALALEPQVVNDAFAYWKRKRLLRYDEKRNSYIFLDIRASMSEPSQSQLDSKLFEYAELNEQLNNISQKRAFTARELDIVYDWIEIFHITHEAVIILVEYCIKKYQTKASIEKMDVIARKWHKNDITTAEKAREYLLGIDLRNSSANKILTKMGISFRNVSQDEHLLYEKWISWGFTLDAIMSVDMSGVQNPNFKYLDKVLADYHSRGLHTARLIKENINNEGSLLAKVQGFAFQLGVKTITPEIKSYYLNWHDNYNMNDEAIMITCKEASKRGINSFNEVNSIIESLARRNKKSAEDIKADFKLETYMYKILKETGVSRSVTQNDKALLTTWLQSVSMDIILLAASYCASSPRPFAALKKIVEDWISKNVKTIEQAKSMHESHSAALSDKPKGKPWRDFNERIYEDKVLDDLFE